MRSVKKKIAQRIEAIRKSIICYQSIDWRENIREIFSTYEKTCNQIPLLKLEQEEDYALYQVRDRKVWFPINFEPSFLKVVYNETFERKVYETKNCHIVHGEWVVDAGACEGFFSLYALEKGANVLVFEPVPEIAKALERTLKSYIDEGRAKVFCLGLGKETLDRTIFLHQTNAGASTLSHEFIGTIGNEFIPGEKLVKIDTLDKIVFNMDIPISFLKADVEGFERELLLGARETIKRYKPNLSICTYHLQDDWQVIPKIVQCFEAGYRISFGKLFHYMYGW